MKTPLSSTLLIFLFSLLTACGGPGSSDYFDSTTAGVSAKMSVDSQDVTDISAGQTAQVYLRLLDEEGFPLSNIALVLDVSVGTLSTNSVTTNSIGEAEVAYTAPADASTETLTITAATGDSGSLSFSVIGSSGSTGTTTTNTAGINLTLTEASTGTEAYSSTEDFKVSIQLLDSAGEPVPQTIINVSATEGSLIQNILLTNDNGEASIDINAPDDLTAGSAPGTFTASSETGFSATVNYEFIATNSTGGDGDPIPATSIKFLSATPELISIKGTGGLGYGETSQVIFKVEDNEGNPVQGAVVDFELSTGVGGLSLSADSALSNASGEVSTTVQAGYIATPVRVMASLDPDPGNGSDADIVVVQSDKLTVTTGIPDQNSVSLSLETFAPEAWVLDGITVPVTIRLADRNNNDIPDGTVVNFTTEGGRISEGANDGSCVTVESTCTVTWTSQNPRPADHRVQILAYAIGHETFYDVNANGIFDDGFDYNSDGVAETPAFDDMTEAYRDDDESGAFNPSASSFAKDENFKDYNSNGLFDLQDGIFNGLPCEDPNGFGVCPGDSDSELTYLRAQATLIMADEVANTYAFHTTGGSCLDDNGKFKTDGSCTSSITFNTGQDYAVIWLMTEDTAALCREDTGSGTESDPYVRQDVVNPNDPACTVAVRQSPATGSTIEVASDVGTLSDLPVEQVENRLSHVEFFMVLASDPENAEANSGTVKLTVTSPSGKKSTATISVVDPAN